MSLHTHALTIVGGAALLALPACGASATWDVVPAAPASTARSGLQSMAPASTGAVLLEAESVSSSGGGSAFGVFGPSPPAPSPWDAAPAAPSNAAAELRARLAPAPVEEAPARYAEADVRTEDGARTATDGTTRALLIYTAQLGLAVHRVAEQQERVRAIATDAGGHLASRADDSIVVRVPSATFDAVLAQVRELGTVVTQQVEVQDVTEEFHDVELRIRTLEAMRLRVEQLLAQAQDVDDALAVEQHLERITVELESLRGRLRLLSDRVAFSTLTVRFAERTAEQAREFQLPFRWLHTLGLQTLMTL